MTALTAHGATAHVVARTIARNQRVVPVQTVTQVLSQVDNAINPSA